ncbi:AraC-like ligand-binding domain-containing protein [Paraburkholderia dipogonis]|jgi:AraC-like DNA-binding protein|uniref:AraC-like ligand-binding domain-containing protein n=1 Tax=Paraburkholderia dipogonis TaxID=1211383 RepID=UPI0038BB4353
MGASMNLDEVPVSRRFSYWRDMAEELYVPVSLSCSSPKTFRFQWDSRFVGDTWAGTSLMTPLHVSRTRQHIARSENDAIKVIVPLSGAISVSQDGHEAQVRAGQFFVIDPAKPYEESITEDLHFIWLHVPRASVTAQIGRIEAVTATALGNETPYARLSMNYVLSLSKVWDDMTGDAGAHANSVALDLLTMAFWERTQQVRLHTSVHRTALFQRAKSFIDEHLADPSLTLAGVAAALDISTRHVRELLAEGGVSYRRYVLEQRLARCAKDLADPCMAHRTVTDIGYSWAFFDSAHFSKAFKAAYGISPRDYRSIAYRL